VSCTDTGSPALHGIATKAIQKLSEVIEVYTTQLRLIESECRELRNRCGSLEFKLNEVKEQRFNLRAEICRLEIGGGNSVEDMQRRATYAYKREWDDLGKHFEDWVKMVRERSDAKKGGAA
jgi:predicted nuclease with TOPRIM domain